MGRGTKK